MQRIPSAHLRTDGAAQDETFWRWRRSIEAYYESIPLYDPAQPGVSWQADQYLIDRCVFIDSTFPRQEFQRDKRWLGRYDDVDHICLQQFLRGRNRVVNGGTQFVQEPDVITTVDLGREVAAVSEDAEVLTFILPRDWLADRVPGLLGRSGVLFGAGSAGARMVGGYLESLRRRLPAAPASEAEVIADTLAGLLAPLGRDGHDLGSRSGTEGMLCAVRHYMEGHIADPGLGVAQLCRQFRCSRATLFRLFKGQGGIQVTLLRLRLMAVFRGLNDPAQDHRSIYDIALDCGFVSPGHLSTQFRRHFGMTPREAREAAQAHARRGTPVVLSGDASGGRDEDTMFRWARAIAAAPVTS